MEEIQYFLFKNQNMRRNLKIIHLLRDPRGMFNSFIKLYQKPNKSSVRKVCKRQMKDIEIRKDLEKQYPNTFMEIHYEDAAANTIDVAKRVYQFIYSENVPEKIRQWIQTHTKYNDTKVKEVLYNTRRRNSTATSLAWKQELDTETRLMIEKECKDVIHYLNGV